MVRLSNILFIIFSSVACAILAMFLSRFFIPKNVGLAGGAMVLFYGLIGLVIGLVISLVIRNQLSRSIVISCNILFSLVIAWFGVQIYQVTQQSKAKALQERERLQKLKPTAAAASIPLGGTPPIGVGIAKPKLAADQALYFYPAPQAKSTPDQLTPIDSVTFKASNQGIEIATAPPWLVPEKLKLDYQIFNFRVLAQHQAFLQVVGNKTNGQTVWIARSQVVYEDWPSFLLKVQALQARDWDNNPLRTKPWTHAPPLLEYGQDNILQPLQIKEDWVQVNILDQNYQKLGQAWLRWRSESELLITYDLLS